MELTQPEATQDSIERIAGGQQLWLAAHGMSEERARLLAALNAAIEDQDRDLKIGPSYLMRDEAATEEGLARVWKYDIMPLLEAALLRPHEAV